MSLEFVFSMECVACGYKTADSDEWDRHYATIQHTAAKLREATVALAEARLAHEEARRA